MNDEVISRTMKELTSEIQEKQSLVKTTTKDILKIMEKNPTNTEYESFKLLQWKLAGLK